MKKIILLLALSGCVQSNEPQITGYTYEGTGQLVTNGFYSPVRKTILRVQDSTGSVRMTDEAGTFFDSLFHVKKEKISDHGIKFTGEVYGESSYGTFILISSDGILDGSYCTGSGTTRVLNLHSVK